MQDATPRRRALIDQIRQLPDKLAASVDDLSAENLLATPIPGEWSIAQIVHHVADSHLNSYVRCKLMATEDNPPLKPYDEAAWARLPDGKSADLVATLQLLRGLHDRWCVFWLNLSDAEWQRSGIHLADGPVTLDKQLQLYVDHGNTHLDQIERVRAALPGKSA